jgi:hypothetical protein
MKSIRVSLKLRLIYSRTSHPKTPHVDTPLVQVLDIIVQSQDMYTFNHSRLSAHTLNVVQLE